MGGVGVRVRRRWRLRCSDPSPEVVDERKGAWLALLVLDIIRYEGRGGRLWQGNTGRDVMAWVHLHGVALLMIEIASGWPKQWITSVNVNATQYVQDFLYFWGFYAFDALQVYV